MNFNSRISLFIFLALSLSVFSCKTKATLVQPAVEEVIEERELEPIVISEPRVEPKEVIVYELPKYNPSYPLDIDIIHTKLDLRFDWAQQHVLGIATLTIKPYFYPTSLMTLDAVGFDINKVSLGKNGTPLKYEYNGQFLDIQLDRTYTREEQVKIYIDYIAKPNENPIGGSAAITSDKGLFFINPLGENKEKPMQIWTQGETENNSRWFPTIDKPNERTTQEVLLTVDDKFKTLSNGVLESSKKNADGTRTDYWKMDLPHSPYLFMLAIGDFAVEKEEWRGKELSYYVEKEYAESAKEIFDHTPEMLDFFSEITGVEYPWPKLGQVAVRDYVSGAMENTTGIIYGSFVQKTNRELIDNNNDMIVAHEIFHHWFGDLVTCESWANLTLNEGFANYSEYLWSEHHNGRESADFHRFNEMRGYVGSTQNGGIHPLIHFAHDDKEDMFDAHSYNKGGLVLHMLRSYLGDDAFFAGFKKYLTDNAYSAVEVDELRIAFEDTCGEDLNWFFNQWYLSAGHPILEVTYGYDAEAKEVTVDIKQTQDPESNPAIFQIPTTIDVYSQDQKLTQYDVWIDQREQGFRFAVDQEPLLVNFDSDKSLLCEMKDNKTTDQYMFQFYAASCFQDRYDAIKALEDNSDAAEVFATAIEDSFFIFRALGVREYMGADPIVMAKIKKLATEDPHSQVRTLAINKLANMDGQVDKEFIKNIVQTEKTYPGVAAAMTVLNKLDPEAALMEADKLKDVKNGSLFGAVAGIFATSDDPKYISFFEDNLAGISLFQSFSFYDQFFNYLKKQKVTDLMSASSKFKILATDSSVEPFRRFASTLTINKIKKHVESLSKEETTAENQSILKANLAELELTIKEIKEVETNPNLLSRYQSF